MPTRALLRIYIAVIVVAVAVPVYVRLSFGRDQRVDLFTSVCETSMIPAFYFAAAVLPVRSYTLATIDRYDSVSDARIYFCVVASMNVLFWIATTAFLLLVVRLLRRRHIAPQASNDAIQRTPTRSSPQTFHD